MKLPAWDSALPVGVLNLLKDVLGAGFSEVQETRIARDLLEGRHHYFRVGQSLVGEVNPHALEFVGKRQRVVFDGELESLNMLLNSGDSFKCISEVLGLFAQGVVKRRARFLAIPPVG